MKEGTPLDGTLTEYIPPSWFHPEGVKKVVRKIKEKLPDVSGRLFITLTLDPHLFSDPKSGFEKARDRIRRVFYKLRKGVKWGNRVFRIDSPYCVKLEFHENGWPHFHIVFLTRRFLPGELLNNLWGLGRTNVARISKTQFLYLLKYVSKSGKIPEWVKEYRSIRIFQPSPGFYRIRDPPENPDRKTPENRSKPRRKRGKLGTIGERQEKWARLAQYKEREKYSRFELDNPWKEIFPRKVYEIAKEGRYLGEGQIKINNTEHLLQLLSDETQNQIKAES